jgi:hypothetical protein
MSEILLNCKRTLCNKIALAARPFSRGSADGRLQAGPRLPPRSTHPRKLTQNRVFLNRRLSPMAPRAVPLPFSCPRAGLGGGDKENAAREGDIVALHAKRRGYAKESLMPITICKVNYGS